jgi:hypothetical protein
MLSAIPSQKSKVKSQKSKVKRKESTSLVSLLSLLPLLSLLFYSNPVQAQINRGGVLLAQPLPPPPNLQPIPINQQALPQLQPAQQFDYNSQTTNQTTPSYQYQYDYQNQYQYQNNQNYERYLVFIDNSNSRLLQEVRRIEPTAYSRQFQGRSVIQAGVFSKPGNAQQRIRELADNGINGARIISYANGQEIPNNYPDRNFPDRNFPDRGYSPNNRSNYYYVAIPARSQDLPMIEDKIRRNIGQSAAILQRSQPRGSHIAVGPFTQRAQAEQWNSYLRNLGFGNARVYYGK